PVPPSVPGPAVTSGRRTLFAGPDCRAWRSAGSGTYVAVDGRLESVPGEGVGLFWCTAPPPPDLLLRLEWRRWRAAAASGALVRPSVPGPAVTSGRRTLFAGPDCRAWRSAGSGTYVAVDGRLESVPGEGVGLFWCTEPTPPDFLLRLEWLRWRETDASGVLVRFPEPVAQPRGNPASVAMRDGFEIHRRGRRRRCDGDAPHGSDLQPADPGADAAASASAGRVEHVRHHRARPAVCRAPERSAGDSLREHRCAARPSDERRRAELHRPADPSRIARRVPQHH